MRLPHARCAEGGGPAARGGRSGRRQAHGRPPIPPAPPTQRRPGWKGHAGSAAVIPADAGLAPGDDAPASKPLPGHAKEQAPADDRPAETLFARKPTKEEKKAAAEARKAKRAARKAAGDPDLGDGEANEDGV